MPSARDIAVSALVRWERDNTFSNVMLDHVLSTNALSAADSAFTTCLVYGTIERLLTLDWLLSKNSRQPLKKCHPTVRAILRVGAYQLVFMEKIPPSAAVNEAVAQAKRMKLAHASGYINGVLRAVDREHKRLLSSLSTDLKSHSIRHSVPLDLLQAWKDAYGLDHAIALAQAANEAPPSVIRVNTLQTSVSDFCEQLDHHAVAYRPIDGLPSALCIEDAAKLKALPALQTQYYFQDTASQWACEALDAQAGETVADVCAAPGGKSITTAMRMGDSGEILSADVYPEKADAMRARAASYGIRSMQVICRDASTPCSEDHRGYFDRVICDVPCSGFGVIRRRPEIRYKSLDGFSSLPDLQYRILCACADMVKSGGVLQYSTCTLRPEENEQIVSRFLAEHKGFAPRVLPLPKLFEISGTAPSHQLTLMPHLHGTDGFFIASFRKEESL